MAASSSSMQCCCVGRPSSLHRSASSPFAFSVLLQRNSNRNRSSLFISTSTCSRNRIIPHAKSNSSDKSNKQEEEEVEVEEELPWIQEKALDVVEFTGSVTQAIPGPRVGSSSLPWLLAVPLAYAALTFVFAFVKTVRKFNSPRQKRKNLVNKNATLCKSIDELFEKGENEVMESALKQLAQKTGFGMEEILRKYIRCALNEKPFDAKLVKDLIELRKASMLDDAKVAEILNEISRRIVKDKGPVVMDMEGYSSKGFKRKLAVQSLFGKIFYLSELSEFCSRDSSLIVKEIFGVTDDDADKLRLHTVSEAGDVDLLEKMVDDSDLEESTGASSDP
ncbi:hypothetical protein RJ641_003580 [Dillenia turbinata]|uniref:Armadillo-like repeats domain-containing protein n=1 Tax=Dillenia turbinata TaxID=194707 RepID=A0AAN8ZBJ5_9MAGN